MLLVYLYHADILVRFGSLEHVDWNGSVVSPLLAFVRVGNTGVDLFFVLSGFLLGRAFLIEAAGGPRVDRVRYFQRRAARILPMYTFVVVAGTLLHASRPSDLLDAIPWLLFLDSFGLTTPFPDVSGAWWSLGVEVHFYLLLPLLPWAWRSTWGRLATAGWIAFYGAYLTGALTPWLGLRIAGISNTILGRLPILLCGIAAAALYARWGHGADAEPTAVRRHAGLRDDALLVVLLGALGLILQRVAATGLLVAELPPTSAWRVPAGILWAGVLLLVLMGRGSLGRLVASRPLAGVGIVSYSVYLLHWPMLAFGMRALQEADPAFIGWGAPATLAVAGITLICLATSTVTYLAIERPAMRWRSRRRA